MYKLRMSICLSLVEVKKSKDQAVYWRMRCIQDSEEEDELSSVSAQRELSTVEAARSGDQSSHEEV